MKKIFTKQVNWNDCYDYGNEVASDFLKELMEKYGVVSDKEDDPGYKECPRIDADAAFAGMTEWLFGNTGEWITVEWSSEADDEGEPLHDCDCADLKNAFESIADTDRGNREFLKFCIASPGCSERRGLLIEELNAWRGGSPRVSLDNGANYKSPEELTEEEAKLVWDYLYAATEGESQVPNGEGITDLTRIFDRIDGTEDTCKKLVERFFLEYDEDIVLP